MGKKSGPPAPDYTAAANAQAAGSQANTTQQTWANRPDQTSPFGNVTWGSTQAVDPSTGQTVTKWTQNTTLDPKLQGALDSQMNLQQGRSDLAGSMLGGVQQTLGRPMDYSQFTQMSGGPGAQNTGTTTSANGFNFGPQNTDTSRQRSPFVDQSRQQTQNINTALQESPQLNAQLGQGAGNIQSGLDFSGAQGVSDAASTRARAEQAAYQSQTSRLDPRFASQQASMESDLANRGISRDSEAYSRAMQDFDRSKNDAYTQAQLGAIGVGGTEAQRDYGMDLGLRQQQVNEGALAGNFANTAQQQQFGQGLQSGQANNAALQSQFGMGQSAQQQQLAAQQAAFGQGSQSRQNQLAAQQAAFGFGNTARQTQLGAQQQAFGQDLASGNFGLQQQQQNFGQNLQANNQNFQQQMQQSGYQNQLRQQQIAEALQQRGMGLNEMNALLSGQQVQNPQFQNFGQAGQAQTPDLLGAQTAQYNAALGGQANSNAAYGDMLGGVGNMAAMYFSDRRLKRIGKRVATHPRGFGLYRLRYIGERTSRIGVIAQEVQRVAPELVFKQPSTGLLMVNYAAL